MDSPTASKSRTAAFLGASLVAGWLVHDLGYIAVTGNIGAVRDTTLASVGILLALTAVAFLLASSRWVLLTVFVLLGVAAVAPEVIFGLARGANEINPPFKILPKALVILIVAFGALESRADRWLDSPRLGAFASGIALAGGFALVRVLRWGVDEPRWTLHSASLLFGLLLFISSARSSGRLRWLLPAISGLLFVGSILAPLVQQSALRRPDLPLAVDVDPSEKQAPNLVLITLDTVRADHLRPYGYHRTTTPLLDDFVVQYATTYRNARSTSSWTLPSHASLLTGTMPSIHGATHPRGSSEGTIDNSAWPAFPMRSDVPTLAEILANEGYATAAMVSNKAYLGYEFGLDRGFARYDDRRPVTLALSRSTLAQMFGLVPTAGTTPYRDAEMMTRLALRWLSDRDRARPYFLFVNYMDAHAPYVPRGRFSTAFEDRKPINPLNSPTREAISELLYDRELLYLDKFLGRLLEYLVQDPDFDDTVVIVTSDHGESFGEHGFWGHDATLYDEVIKVPLYIKPSGVRAAASVEQPTSGIEVFRLALELTGQAREIPTAESHPALAEWFSSTELAAKGRFPTDIDRDLLTWLEGDLKFIIGSTGSVEIYDLSQDLMELNDLASSGIDLEKIKVVAAEWWAAHPPNHEIPSEPLDPDAEQQLRALGYIE